MLLLSSVILKVCTEGCAEIPPGQWFSIGPHSIDNICSGRATVIAVNPFNYQDVWLGTATGGVWHTTNVMDVGVQ